MKLFLCFSIVFLLPLAAFAQQEELNKFLTACQSINEAEAQKTIRDYSFNYKPESELLDFGGIKAEVVETDIPGLKAFAGSVVCKIKANEKVLGKQLTTDKKMFFIMYYDKVRKHWAVFGFRDYLKPEEEFSTSKAKVESGSFYSAKEFVYRNLAYWALMAGKVSEAQTYTKLALEAAETNKNESFLIGNEKVMQAIL
ncbi:hypothetical protein [Spirosoma spitsbergense]|uniref:hypothetical protein n=1 Tax=Spirosoma spitsbergense TaxID=431554 RepID=UPI0012FAE372|nr:hypothetical protein [Spirosoma spitsbergense]